MAASREFRAAVEYSDIVEAEKASRKDVSTLRIFSIDPPIEVRHQPLEGPFQETNIGAAQLPLNVEQQQSRPGMDGRVHVAEVPLVGWNLAVRMRVQTPEHEQELVFRKIKVHE